MARQESHLRSWDTLSGILDRVSDGVALLTREGRVARANPPARALLGLDPLEEAPQGLVDILAAGEGWRREQIVRACRSGAPLQMECRPSVDGRTRCLDLHLAPLLPDLTAAWIRDLTRGRAIAGKLGLRACYQEAAAGVLRGPARRARLNDLLDGSLAILGRARRVSRSYIFVNDDERGLMTCRNEWAAPGVESFLGMTAAHGDFPYWLARLRADLPVVGGDILRDLPEEVHEILTLQGIVSILVVPLRVDRRLWGFLGLDECAARREWSRLEVSLLGEFGDLIACLIGRRRSRGARPAPAATANT